MGVVSDGAAASIRTVRDHFAAVGQAAFEEPAVGATFKNVWAFEAKECGE